MFVYRFDSIEQWSGWQRPADLFRESSPHSAVQTHDPALWVRLWSEAQRHAQDKGLTVDVREGPYVTVIPDYKPGLSEVIIAWKQGGDKTTIVVSRLELPWLSDFII